MIVLQVIVVPVSTGNGGVGTVLGYWILMVLGYLTGIRTFYKACRDYYKGEVTEREWDSVEYIIGGRKLKHLVERRFLDNDGFLGFIGGVMYSTGGLIAFCILTVLLGIFFFVAKYKF